MTSPRNTSKPDFVDAVDILFGGGIESQEKAGQQQLLRSTTLPTEIIGSEAAFLELGFTLGAVVEGDPLFREATLPEGWRREGTDHSMHTNIVDERGIERVGVFYKAAFYDRKAHMSLTNVGRRVASSFIYGDGQTPHIHADLTDDELGDAREEAESYLHQAEECPSVYADRVPRARQVLEALEARGTGRSSK